MKSGRLRKAVRLSGMVAVVLVMCLLSGLPAWAGSSCNCENIAFDVTAHATTTNPLGQYVGTAQLTLINQKNIYQADVVINPQGEPTFNADGTIYMQLRNQFSTPALASTFECYDHLTLSPVNGDPTLYTITNQVVIFNGTGVFGPAYGKLIAQGQLSMTEGSIRVKASGLICDLADIK